MTTLNHAPLSGNPGIDQVISDLLTTGFKVEECVSREFCFAARLKSEAEIVTIAVTFEFKRATKDIVPGYKYKSHREVDGWVTRGDIHSSVPLESQRVSEYLKKDLK